MRLNFCAQFPRPGARLRIQIGGKTIFSELNRSFLMGQ
jgi:hypothetical protein